MTKIKNLSEYSETLTDYFDLDTGNPVEIALRSYYDARQNELVKYSSWYSQFRTMWKRKYSYLSSSIRLHKRQLKIASSYDARGIKHSINAQFHHTWLEHRRELARNMLLIHHLLKQLHRERTQ